MPFTEQQIKNELTWRRAAGFRPLLAGMKPVTITPPAPVLPTFTLMIPPSTIVPTGVIEAIVPGVIETVEPTK